MLRSLTLALVACTIFCAPGRGQTSPATPGDSLLQAARADADRDARDPFVGGYFGSSFLGGAALGLMAPIVALFPNRETATVAAAGGVLVFATFDQAGQPVRTLPDSIRWRVAEEPPEYHEAYRAAYAQRLTRRRVRAAKTGGITGALAGVGFFGFLAYSFATADF
ncbi:MAG TPA: hypothetical protein VF647_22105 [Longimicrobium sp.]|jgi:hypothetical protein